jgi:hypothetical protein
MVGEGRAPLGQYFSRLLPIGGERLQRVKVRLPGFRILRRYRTAADVPLWHNDRLPRFERDGRATRLPRGRLSRRRRNSSGEPATIDAVDAEVARNCAQGAGAEDGGRAAAHAIRRRPGSPDKPEVTAREVGDCFAPGSFNDADVDGCAPKLRVERSVEVDVVRKGRTVRERKREHGRPDPERPSRSDRDCDGL